MERDSKGRFSSGKWFVVKFIGLPVVVIALGLTIVYMYQHPKIVTNTVTVDISSAQYAQKIDSLEKDIVLQVEKCERMGYTEADGLVTYDPTDAQYAKNQGKRTFVNTGELSFGVLQFKVNTVIFYEKKLYNKVFTGKDAILLALDATSSRQLAQDVMFKSSNLATDWANCSNKLSLEAQIVAIKKIK